MSKMKQKFNVGANFVRPQRGITLIALVITIIVMLILAAVTLAIALNGGLFGQAGEAAKSMDVATAKEQITDGLTGKIIERMRKDEIITVGDVEEILDQYVQAGYDSPSIENGKIVFDGIDFYTLTKGNWFQLEDMSIFGIAGTGDSEPEFVPIYTQADLQKIASGQKETLSDGNKYTMAVNGTYKIMDDIVITTPFTPIETFAGTLEGNGKTISNLTITKYICSSIPPILQIWSCDHAAGVAFIYENSGTIRNLEIENILNLKGDVEEMLLVAGICIFNTGNIETCNVIFSDSIASADALRIAGFCVVNEGYIDGCSISGGFEPHPSGPWSPMIGDFACFDISTYIENCTGHLDYYW